MNSIGQLLQSGDWKGEKHVPVIHCPDAVKADEYFEIKVGIGDAIPHPNTLEHHIAWTKVFFQAEGSKFPVEVANFSFAAHGESDIFTDPIGVVQMKTKKPGTVYAISYCNIHGLWENSKSVKVES